MPNRFIKFKKAYTLVELLVVVLLLSVIGLVVSAMIARGFENYRFSQIAIDTQENAAKAMGDFEKSSRGTTQVVESSSSVYEFYTYLANDMQPAPSKIRYFVENGEFKKGIIAPVGTGPTFDYPAENENIEPICKHVTNGTLLFNYFNDSNVEIPSPVPPDAVKMVQFTITLDKDTSKKPEAITEITKVNLRNLKTNL